MSKWAQRAPATILSIDKEHRRAFFEHHVAIENLVSLARVGENLAGGPAETFRTRQRRKLRVPEILAPPFPWTVIMVVASQFMDLDLVYGS